VEQLIDLPAIQTVLQTLRDWLFREVLVVSTLVQLVVVAATFAVAQMAANGFRRFVAREIDRRQLVGSLRKIADTDNFMMNIIPNCRNSWSSCPS